MLKSKLVYQDDLENGLTKVKKSFRRRLFVSRPESPFQDSISQLASEGGGNVHDRGLLNLQPIVTDERLRMAP
jgi:hypothetical protein